VQRAYVLLVYFVTERCIDPYLRIIAQQGAVRLLLSFLLSLLFCLYLNRVFMVFLLNFIMLIHLFVLFFITVIYQPIQLLDLRLIFKFYLLLRPDDPVLSLRR
jgi:hypothetical protein